MFSSFSKVTGRRSRSKAVDIILKRTPSTCHTPPWKDNGSRTHSCLSSRLHLDFYPPQSVKSLSLIFGQRRGPTEHEAFFFFFELMVQLVNSHNITKTEIVAVIWGSDGTPLVKAKTKHKNKCVFLPSGQLLWLSTCPRLAEGHRLPVAEFDTFYKHPLASEQSFSLCPEPWPVNMWYFALMWLVVHVCLRHKSKWPVPMQPQQRGTQHPLRNIPNSWSHSW